ncbi:MAG: hypothetical protein NC418_07330 [Muribaculaceae bacterium]|nr:hypothetical protein [Muribaculaceae bacterium]
MNIAKISLTAAVLVAAPSYAQIINVEEIATEAFTDACSKDASSIAPVLLSDSCICAEIEARAKAEFFKLTDEVRRRDYDYAPEYGSELVYTIAHYPALNIYAVEIPRINTSEAWCFDECSLAFLGAIPAPVAINREGVMMSQIFTDCDNSLNLSFYKRSGNQVIELATFMCPFFGVPFATCTDCSGAFYIGPSEIFSRYQCLKISL